jgi:hypothetical protein
MGDESRAHPEISRGDYCLWGPDEGTPDEQCSLAIVTRVGGGSIDVGVIVPGSATMLPRTGVPHRTDNRQRIANLGEGCWRALDPSLTMCLAQEALALARGLGDLLAKLEGKVASLRGQVLTLQKKLKVEGPPEETAADQRDAA